MRVCAGTDPWRIRNFVTASKAFGIVPELRQIEGTKKSIRYFSGVQLAKMGIALLLIGDGFTPTSTTSAINTVPDALIRRWLDAETRDEAVNSARVLLRLSGTWQLVTAAKANELINPKLPIDYRLADLPHFYMLQATGTVWKIRGEYLS